MKCTKCGAELVPEAKFCNVCGEAVVLEKAKEPLAPEMVTTPSLAPSFEESGPLPSLDIIEEPTTPSIIETTPVIEESSFVEPTNQLEPVTEAVSTEPASEAASEAPAPEVPVQEVPVSAPVETPQVTKDTPAQVPIANKPGFNPAIIAVVLLLLVVAVGGGIFAGKALFGGKEDKKDDEPKVEVVKTKVGHGGIEYEIPSEYDYTVENGILIIEVSDDLAYGINNEIHPYTYYENTVNRIQKSCNDTIASGCKLDQKKNKYLFLRYEQDYGDYHFYKIEGAVKSNNGDGIFISIAKMSEDIKEEDIKIILDIVSSAKPTNNIYRNSEGETDLSKILESNIDFNGLDKEVEEVEDTLDVVTENPIPEE